MAGSRRPVRLAAAWAAGRTSPAARANPAALGVTERREDHSVDGPVGCQQRAAGVTRLDVGPDRVDMTGHRAAPVDGGKADRHLGADARGRGGQRPGRGGSRRRWPRCPGVRWRQDAAGGHAGGARRARRCHGGGRSRPPGPGTGHAGRSHHHTGRRGHHVRVREHVLRGEHETRALSGPGRWPRTPRS